MNTDTEQTADHPMFVEPPTPATGYRRISGTARRRRQRDELRALQLHLLDQRRNPQDPVKVPRGKPRPGKETTEE